MRQTYFVFLFAMFVFSQTSAQDYKTAIGFRGGTQNGLTVKHFLNESSAVEGLIATRWEGFYLTGIYEILGPYFDVPGMSWYYGAGVHLGFIDGNNVRFTDGKDHTLFGIDGIIGVEYNFETLPFNVGLDWKPQFDFIGDTYFVWDDLAFSVRFTF